ncbi:MAG: SH3 domain-containing protein [Clostridia bacterium]|nr:SH3 domain-containing protein [Clostridia bacterium]
MNRKQRGMKRLAAAILVLLLLTTTAAVPAALAETFSAIVTAEEMLVYRDAKLQAQASTLPKDTVVRVKSYSGKAAKIDYSGKTGYAPVSDMKALDDVAKKAVVNTDAKMYKKPGGDGKAQKVKKGAKVYVISKSGKWARVEQDGSVGYMKLSALTKADDNWQTAEASAEATSASETAQKGTVTLKTLPVYKKANAKSGKVCTLKQGQVVDVLKWNTKWARVSVDGKTGYCVVKGLAKGEKAATAEATPAPTGTPATATKKLNIYKKASGSAAKLGTLKAGDAVEIFRINGKWAYIQSNGTNGYVSAAGLSTGDDGAAISPTQTPSTENAVRGTVTVNSLAIHKTASAKSDKVASASKGDVLNVLKWNEKWAFVEREGKYGFCDVAGLSKVETGSAAAPTSTPSLDQAVKAAVSAESATVYSLASDSSEELGTLMWGEQVNVLSVTGGWAYVERNGKFGFCAKSALTKTQADPGDAPSDYKKAKFKATVVYPGAKVYERASTSSKSKKLKLGKTVKVTAYSRNLEWACVTNGKGRGFVPVKHLSRGKYSPVTGNGSALQTLLKGLLTYGYYDGVPTTNYNTAAITAIKRFQAACGLPETGLADTTMQRILFAGYAPADPLLSKTMNSKDSGADVKRVQLRLYALGYLAKAESIDSNYGATTATAVGLFQRSNGISVTCVADTATLKALYSTAATARPGSVKAADEGGSVSIGEVLNPQGTVKLSSTYVTTMPEELKSTTSGDPGESASAGQRLEYAIYNAQENLGKPYVYGSTGPNSFDCSGLTTYAFRKIGVSLKRSAYSQGYDSGYDKIEGVGNLKRGDLVFFNTISDSDLSDHAGIYLGGGCFIHASSGGHKVVVSNLTTGFYNRVFSWGRRVLK